MVGLVATVIGLVTLAAIILSGLWLTWLSLGDERHTPAVLQREDPDEVE